MYNQNDAVKTRCFHLYYDTRPIAYTRYVLQHTIPTLVFKFHYSLQLTRKTTIEKPTLGLGSGRRQWEVREMATYGHVTTIQRRVKVTLITPKARKPSKQAG